MRSKHNEINDKRLPNALDSAATGTFFQLSSCSTMVQAGAEERGGTERGPVGARGRVNKERSEEQGARHEKGRRGAGGEGETGGQTYNRRTRDYVPYALDSGATGTLFQLNSCSKMVHLESGSDICVGMTFRTHFSHKLLSQVYDTTSFARY